MGKMEKLRRWMKRTKRKIVRHQEKKSKTNAHLEKMKAKQKSKITEATDGNTDNSTDDAVTASENASTTIADNSSLDSSTSQEPHVDEYDEVLANFKRMMIIITLAVCLVLCLTIYIIVPVDTHKEKHGILWYFAKVDEDEEDYYEEVTSDQAIEVMHFFDFKHYLEDHDNNNSSLQEKAVFREISSELIDVANWKNTYRREIDNHLNMQYYMSLGDRSPSVFIETSISPAEYDFDEVRNESRVELVFYKDDVSNEEYPVSVYTPWETVDMSTAVYDTDSAFFCGRETFKIMVALIESGRMEKYPNRPLIGLYDVDAPMDEQSKLLRKFHTSEHYRDIEGTFVY